MPIYVHRWLAEAVTSGETDEPLEYYANRFNDLQLRGVEERGEVDLAGILLGGVVITLVSLLGLISREGRNGP